MKNLKVGQSFEVMEVLDNLGYEYLKGIHRIVTRSYCGLGFVLEHAVPNGVERPYMYESGVKPIGKLTITKLKH